MEKVMEELFELIEEKIIAAGYTGEVNGEEIYDFMNSEIADLDLGTYILMSKEADDIIFEYKVEIYPKDFNLSYIKITEGEVEYFIDFD